MVISFIGNNYYDIFLLTLGVFVSQYRKVLVVDHNTEDWLSESLDKPLRLSGVGEIVTYEHFDYTDVELNDHWSKVYDVIMIDGGNDENKSDNKITDYSILVSDGRLPAVKKITTLYESRKSELKQKYVTCFLRNVMQGDNSLRYLQKYLKERIDLNHLFLVEINELDQKNLYRAAITGNIGIKMASRTMKNSVFSLTDDILEVVNNG